MAITVTKILKTQDILNKISEADIFRTYCNGFKSLNKNFCSELREDNNPSCLIKVGDNGRLYYCDLANGSFMDCFDYVMEKYNLTLQEALSVINNDFFTWLQHN